MNRHLTCVNRMKTFDDTYLTIAKTDRISIGVYHNLNPIHCIVFLLFFVHIKSSYTIWLSATVLLLQSVRPFTYPASCCFFRHCLVHQTPIHRFMFVFVLALRFYYRWRACLSTRLPCSLLLVVCLCRLFVCTIFFLYSLILFLLSSSMLFFFLFRMHIV